VCAVGAVTTRHEATLIRFAGDGVMVLVNAPVTCENPAHHGVGPAIDMQVSTTSVTDASLYSQARARKAATREPVRVVANFGIAENEILACMRLNGSDGSVDSEWQTSANYILVEVGQND
jgi:hypothetical protein